MSFSPSTPPSPRLHRNLLLLGAGAVGKSSLCVRFASDRFDDSYEPTYENSYTKLCHYKGKEIECKIKDTQGLNTEDRFRAEYGLGIHGYILVYSINSLHSFLTVKSINDKLCDCVGTREIPRILVGHKSDLGSNTNTGTNKIDAVIDQRQVSVADGLALARELGIPFIECSSKNSSNVDNVFMTIFDEINRANEPNHYHSHCWDAFKACLASPSVSCNCVRPMDSFLSQGTETNKWERTVGALITLTLLLGLTGIITGIYLGLTASNNNSEIMAYLLFGFSFVLALISLIGIFGVRQSLIEFMRVYSIALTVLFVIELIVYFTLLIKNVPAFTVILIEATIITAITCLVYGISAGVVWCYVYLLQANNHHLLTVSAVTPVSHSNVSINGHSHSHSHSHNHNGNVYVALRDDYQPLQTRRNYSGYQTLED